jgi:2,4-dienoyl-CoA reductase-like NADH-dependent reductase (Old Yellow Enzyme family)
MLTHGDKTVTNCLDILDQIADAGVSHIGFKDIGVDIETLATLSARIKESGATSYMEVVSTTPESVHNSISTAAEIGVDRVLGGQDAEFALNTLNGTGATYYPFPGRPVDHPTILKGSPEDIEADCARYRANGCPGIDLLAYRASDANPLDLIRAARVGLNDGYLIVAGSIDSPQRIHDIAEAGADAFTIGTAVFDNVFAAGGNTVAYQCKEVLKICETID